MSEQPERRGLAAEGVESLGRIRLQGFALLALAFIAGVAAGGAVMRVRDRAHGWIPRERFGFMGPVMRGGLPPFFDQLGLTAEQKEKINGILARRRPLTDSILRASLPRLRAVTESTRAEIRAVLTPEQRTKMDRMFERERHGRQIRTMIGPGGVVTESLPLMPPPPPPGDTKE